MGKMKHAHHVDLAPYTDPETSMTSDTNPRAISASPTRPSSIALAIGVALMGGTSLSLAQESPYYLGATQTFTTDSNIARTAKGSEIRDTLSSTGLRAGFDQPFGQQRVNLSADVATNRYSSSSRLNNTSYGLTSRLDWATIDNISGSLSLDSRQALNLLDVDAAQAGLQRNVQRTDTYGFTVQKGNVTLLTLDAGVSGNRVSNSEAATANRDYRQQIYTAGVRVQPSPILGVRLGVRHTDGRYPSFSATASDKVKRNDLDLSANYELSGLSRLNARLSYTNEQHSASAQRGLKGVTGAMGWSWKPTGKLGLDVQLARDTSIGGLSQVSTQTSRNNDALVRDSLTLGGTWEASAFINVRASLGYARRTLDNAFYDPATATVNGGKDYSTTASLGLTYTPLRNLVFGCGMNWENRSVDGSGVTTTTFAYSGTSLSCYGQAYLR
jgi:hypothetical protein